MSPPSNQTRQAGRQCCRLLRGMGVWELVGRGGCGGRCCLSSSVHSSRRRGPPASPPPSPSIALFPRPWEAPAAPAPASPRGEPRSAGEKVAPRPQGPWGISGNQESLPVPEPSAAPTDTPSLALTVALGLVALFLGGGVWFAPRTGPCRPLPRPEHPTRVICKNMHPGSALTRPRAQDTLSFLPLTDGGTQTPKARCQGHPACVGGPGGDPGPV